MAINLERNSPPPMRSRSLPTFGRDLLSSVLNRFHGHDIWAENVPTSWSWLDLLRIDRSGAPL
jgi:hypothetical protein